MDIKKIGEEMGSRVSAPVIMLIIALLIAGIISFWVYGFLTEKSKIKAVAAKDTQLITIAAFDMSWGTVITPEQVKTAPYFKGSLPTGYIPAPASAVGRVVLYPVKVNEPITESKLAPVNVTSGGLAAVVQPKKRAMAVRVDKVVGVSGFIHPGHRVDVLVSVSASEDIPRTITKIVLENILVLAAGTQVDQSDKKKGEAAAVDVITLEVTPEEGEKLAMAASEGKLQLALRGYTDTEDVLTRGATRKSLLSSYVGGAGGQIESGAERTAVKRAPARSSVRSYSRPAYSKPFTVELIMGTKSSEEKFVREGE